MGRMQPPTALSADAPGSASQPVRLSHPVPAECGPDDRLLLKYTHEYGAMTEHSSGYSLPS